MMTLHHSDKWLKEDESKLTPCVGGAAKCVQKNAILDEFSIRDRFFKVIQGAEKRGMKQTFPYSVTYSEEVILHLIYILQLLKIFRRSSNLSSSFSAVPLRQIVRLLFHNVIFIYTILIHHYWSWVIFSGYSIKCSVVNIQYKPH